MNQLRIEFYTAGLLALIAVVNHQLSIPIAKYRNKFRRVDVYAKPGRFYVEYWNLRSQKPARTFFPPHFHEIEFLIGPAISNFTFVSNRIIALYISYKFLQFNILLYNVT